MQKIPEIHILSDKFEPISEVKIFTSLVYERSWQSIGNGFKLHLPYKNEGELKKYAKGNYIYLYDSIAPRCGRICDIEIIEGETDVITLSGFPCGWYTSTRMNKRPDDDATAIENFGYDSVPFVHSGELEHIAAETVLKTYIFRHMTNPTDPARKIPLLTIAPDLLRGKKMVWLAGTGTPLDKTIEDICSFAEIGYEIKAAPDIGMTFDIIEGTDRSRNQDKTKPVVFSIDGGSALSTAYSDGEGDYKNVGYALGEEYETGLRAIYAVTQEPVMPRGADRREILIDCGDLSVAESDTQLSMTTKAMQELAKYKIIKAMSASAFSNDRYEYGRDYDLGDIVTAENAKIGISADLRVTAVRETYEPDDIRITPVLGDAPDTKIRLIKAINKIII